MVDGTMVKRASKLMDNAIKQEESHGRDLSHRKPLIVIECHNLRFSQQSIKEEFRDGSSLRGLINELAANPDQAYRIPPLRIFKSGAHYVSLDNRRLACLFECSRFFVSAFKSPLHVVQSTIHIDSFEQMQSLDSEILLVIRSQRCFCPGKRSKCAQCF